MSILVRAFKDEDYPRLVEVNNLVFPDDHWTIEEALAQDRPWTAGPFERLRVVAEDAHSLAVGFGRLNRRTQSFRFREFEINIIVDPSQQRRGFGSAILKRLMDELRARQAPIVSAHVRESIAHGVAFLKHHNFVEVRRSLEWTLDPAALDPDRFTRAERLLAEQGISLTSLAAERRQDPTAVRKLFELHTACVGDVQAIRLPADTLFDYFVARIVEGIEALPEGYALAKAGQRYVGESILRRSGGQPHLTRIWFTGVSEDYRGRGIGTALTLSNIRFAREYGYRQIGSGTSARNRPIVRIYESLGFGKCDGWVVFERRLEAG